MFCASVYVEFINSLEKDGCINCYHLECYTANLHREYYHTDLVVVNILYRENADILNSPKSLKYGILRAWLIKHAGKIGLQQLNRPYYCSPIA